MAQEAVFVGLRLVDLLQPPLLVLQLQVARCEIILRLHVLVVQVLRVGVDESLLSLRELEVLLCCLDGLGFERSLNVVLLV